MRTLPESKPLVLVMVGLPARGKTYIARKLARYLNWLGVSARVFNVGNYRRKHLGSSQPAAFFDPENAEGYAARRRMALAALKDMIQWLKEDGNRVAIYDATNGTPERRELVREQLAHHELRAFFVESISTNTELIEANIRETKLSMPDYAESDPDQAVRDFRERIANYERSYVPVHPSEGSYVKLIDVGQQIHLNRIEGSLASRVVVFLMNLHVVPRPIYLMRHGESLFNEENRIGGDAPLTSTGWKFARALKGVLRERIEGEPMVWTSTLQRAVSTASALEWPLVKMRNLDEIDAGECDGMTYDDVKLKLPNEFQDRARDKLNYRYPRGESYQDVIERLDPVILELERQRRPVVIVAHQAVLRCLYGYLMDQAPTLCPHLPMPLHTVIELVPKAYGPVETRFEVPV